MEYNIKALKALKDNYIWLIHDEQKAIVIDPTLANPVAEYLAVHSLELQAIMLTHAHHDHIGGVEQLRAWFSPLVYDNFKDQLSEKQIIQIGEFPEFKVLLTPGHTFEHVCFWFDQQHLFCGDTLFAQGCGRVFTNDYALMLQSLSKIQALPDEVLCYPAHEYTLNNLRFTTSLDPDKDYYSLYAKYLLMKFSHLQNTLPSLLADEKKYNLFLRCHDPLLWSKLAAQTGEAIQSSLACFIAIRQLRNNFN